MKLHVFVFKILTLIKQFYLDIYYKFMWTQYLIN